MQTLCWAQVEHISEEHEAELATLRGSIVEAVDRFAGGALSAEGLLDSLRGMGLQVRRVLLCPVLQLRYLSGKAEAGACSVLLLSGV